MVSMNPETVEKLQLFRGNNILLKIDDWRDIAIPKDYTKPARVRTVGANTLVTGFGNEHEETSRGSGSITGTPNGKGKDRSFQWWFEEDGLLNLDEEGCAEKRQCAVAASNIIRNFSFMPDNEMIMAQHRNCLETIFQCIEDHNTGDNEERYVRSLKAASDYGFMKQNPESWRRSSSIAFGS